VLKLQEGGGMANSELLGVVERFGEQIRSARDLDWNELKNAIDMASLEGDNAIRGTLYYYAAYYMLNAGKHYQCLLYLNDAFRDIYQCDNEQEAVKCYHLLGVVAHGQNNLLTAMDSYAKALGYAREGGQNDLYCVILAGMADVYHMVGAYEKAAKYYGEFLVQSTTFDLGSEKMYNLLKKVVAGYGHSLIMADKLERARILEAELNLMFTGEENDYTVRMAVYSFYGFMAYHRGEWEQMQQYTALAVSNVQRGCTTSVAFQQISNLLQFLVACRNFDALEQVLNFVEPQAALEGNEGFLQKLLVHRLKYCSNNMESENFLQSAKIFFELRDKLEQSESVSVRQMVDMREKLRKMEENQLALEAQNHKLLYQARHDELSGLYNKRYLNVCMEDIFEEAVVKEEPLGILFVDIDFFKQVNDRYGHQRGDECIVKLAKAIQKSMPGDFAARYGGDEFVVISVGRERKEFEDCAQALVENVRRQNVPNEEFGIGGILSITVGAVHAVPSRTDKIWDFLAKADASLYRQKNAAKGQICFSDSI